MEVFHGFTCKVVEGLLTEQYALKEAVNEEGRGPCFGPDSRGPIKNAVGNIRHVLRVSSDSRGALSGCGGRRSVCLSRG